MSAADLLITGGLGLIGSAIAEEWEGERATIVDDGRAAVVGIKDIRAGARPRWVIASVQEAAERFPRAAVGARAVVHCAAPVGPVGILTGNVLTELVEGTVAACRLAARAEVPLIVLSSSEVHGTTVVGPTLEVPDRPWVPRTEYAVGKIAAELIAGRHRHETGLPTAIIRPWNVTGPRQTAGKGFVLPRWVDATLAGEPLELYGTGRQERAIMAVRDFAVMVCALIDGQIHPRGAWDAVPLHAATPANRTSLRDLAELVGQEANRAGREASPVELVDPVELHGGLFAEASSGTKLPPEHPELEGWTPLDHIVAEILAERGATLSP